MKFSVVICTYRRSEPLTHLLESLASQTLRDFEVLLVDGAGSGGLAQTRELASAYAPNIDVKVLASPKGLTTQRNVGLKTAAGDTICFLDDDVTFDSDFLSKVADVLDRPDMQDVGGVTAYDVINYPHRMNYRWRLRRWLGIIPSLCPGDINHLGVSVPVSFFPRFSGTRSVGFFYGFCMIFRKTAIEGLWFDEQLPTYGGEDRDFSFRVSRRWPLVLCGDLQMRHSRSEQSRDSLVQRTYQTGFGAGRAFAKHHTSILDYFSLGWSIIGEFAIDLLAFFQKPSLNKVKMPVARVAGTLAGVRSRPSPETPMLAAEPTYSPGAAD